MAKKRVSDRSLRFEVLDRRDLCAGDVILYQEQPFATGGGVVYGGGGVNPGGTQSPYRNRPEIDVQGIVDGQAGAINLQWGYTSLPPSREFVIANIGGAPLVVQGVQVPSGFVASRQSFTLRPGERISLSISCDTGIGIKQGEVRILSNDADESVYNFTVRGRVLANPEYRATSAGLLRPQGNGVFLDLDTRLARKIEVLPPTGQVPAGTRYVVEVELSTGQRIRYCVGGQVLQFQFSRLRPSLVTNLTSAALRFRGE